MIAQQSELCRLRPNQQPINKHQFFLLLEQIQKSLGVELGEGDEKWADGCTTVEQFIYRMLDTQLFKRLALENNPITQANLTEFYVCLRCGLTWDPSPGFDLYGALRYQEEIKAGKIEVKHGGDVKNGTWSVQATGKKKVLEADALVFLGMPRIFNPCEGTMLVIPSSALRETIDQQKKDNPDRIPQIYISANRQNKQTKRLNGWYEFELIDHTLLKDQLSRYVHGIPVVVHQPYQFSLF